jgi:hypothetical protein
VARRTAEAAASAGQAARLTRRVSLVAGRRLQLLSQLAFMNWKLRWQVRLRSRLIRSEDCPVRQFTGSLTEDFRWQFHALYEHPDGLVAQTVRDVRHQRQPARPRHDLDFGTLPVSSRSRLIRSDNRPVSQA